MLPHINTKNRHLPPNHRILILGRHDPQPTIPLLDQPSPAAALNAQQRLAHGLLELVQAAPGLGDLGRQLGRGGGVRVWGGRRGEVLPEEGVVDMAAAVELDGGLEGDLGGHVVGGEGGGVGLEGVVEVGHVGLVVLAVVKLHDLGRDAGLEGL